MHARLAGLAVLLTLGAAETSRAAVQPGELYFASFNAVYTIAKGGNLSGATPFATGLSGVEDLCIGPGGDLYVTEYDVGEVTVISNGGDFSGATPFASGIGQAGTLSCSATKIYVTDVGGGRVLDVSAGGDFSAAAGFASGLDRPAILMRDAAAKLWVAEVSPFSPPSGIYDITAGGSFAAATPFATYGQLMAGLAEHGGNKLVSLTSAGAVVIWDNGGALENATTFATGLAIGIGPAALLVASGRLLVTVTAGGGQPGGAVYDITAGGDFTNAVPFATGLSPDYGGMAHLPDVCGDGFAGFGVECDDKGESATCNANCTKASCGDGIVNITAGEACDDKGESATCNADCTKASCGDGTLNMTAGEQCDDKGESATCNANCTKASCGDGTLNVTAGEACDDGNVTSGDGCSATCQIEMQGTGGAGGAGGGATAVSSGAGGGATGGAGTGGDAGAGGAKPSAGSGGDGSGSDTTSSSGCGCRLGPSRGASGWLVLAVGVLGLAARRARPRPRRA
jgi:cysteine-rich repeat protein